MANKNTDNRADRGRDAAKRRGAHSAPAPDTAKRSRAARAEDTGAKRVRAAEEKAAAKAAKAEEKAAKKEQKALRAEQARPARQKALKRLKITLVCLLFLAVLAFAGATVGGYTVTNNGVNFPKVYIGDIFVGGLSYEETLSLLEAEGWDEEVNTALRVQLPADASFKVDLCDSGAAETKESAAAAAYRYGHSSNWYSNLFLYAANMLRPVDVEQAELRLDQDYIRERAQGGIDKFLYNTAAPAEPYTVDQERELLCLTKGAGEMRIDLDSLCASVSAALLSGDKELVYDHIDNELTMPDFDAIHTELGREPSNARFSDSGFDVIDEVVGCAFDVQEAQRIWQAAQPGEPVEIALDITYPEITGEALRGMLFRDQLGQQITSYAGSTSARINNIHLATSKIDGIILMPGEEFSYNGVVGQRTKEAGFEAADAYNDGEVVQEIGGGICQVSSTLYCAIRYAQLEVTDRTNHYFKVGYLPYSMDATVSWGGPEFKFVNCRDFPVKIVAYCDDEYRELNVEIWGTDVDGTYVELPHETYMIFDETYPDVVIGYAVQAYRDIYDANGLFLDRIKEPYGYSIYHFHYYDIKWPEEAKQPSDDSQGGTVDIPAPPSGGGGGDGYDQYA